MRYFGGFPYTWNQNELKFRLKPSFFWSLYSSIIATLVIPYHFCLIFVMKFVSESYASNPILWKAYVLYAVCRLLITIMLYLNVSLLKIHQVKRFVKEALKLYRKWNCKCSLRQKIQVKFLRFGLLLIYILPWIYIIKENSSQYFSLTIYALDTIFLLRADTEHLKALYYGSLLANDCLRQCFDIFFQETKVAIQLPRSKKYITVESVMKCMRKYKQIRKFLCVQMAYFKSIIISTIGLQICIVIMTTFCLTQVPYTRSDFYLYLSLDLTAVVFLVLFFNSMMLHFTQVREFS